ncbi:hypothetical protein HGI59_06645 [Clostridium saccharobutylicum]|nr:hypothetical protein [Clostridium saccharobutylicum]MBC2412877.1 hypothetical protein [Clostridium saccharobutylicum]MBC2437079.1 hypothetical protein [Clostridium saccharobutylicum]MBC2440043.1 hypothetical protein [Clostridium saccharobutylicum]MBC2444793.1 hypothetical protein [Clostridium saccharobutylicum]
MFLYLNIQNSVLKAFTLSVQTTSDQHIIPKGFYPYITNPPYTKSILSFLGIPLHL